MGGGTPTGSLKVETGSFVQVGESNTVTIPTSLNSIKMMHVYSDVWDTYSTAYLNDYFYPFRKSANLKTSVQQTNESSAGLGGSCTISNANITLQTNGLSFINNKKYNYIIVGE